MASVPMALSRACVYCGILLTIPYLVLGTNLVCPQRSCMDSGFRGSPAPLSPLALLP